MRSSRIIWTTMGVAAFVQASAIPHHHQDASVRLLHEYPAGTWIENIAVRPSGELLLTLLNTPHLDQLDPFGENHRPKTIYSFPRALGVLGIAEIEEDVFTIVAGNFSLSTQEIQSESWALWKANFSGTPYAGLVNMERIAHLPQLTLPNGMCALPCTPTPHDILIGDLKAGKIWRVDTRTGKYTFAIENSLTATSPTPVLGPVGVNGIHIQGDTLYFSNTGQGLFAQMPISPNGTATGEASIVARYASKQSADDFALHGDAAFLVTGSGNSIKEVSLTGAFKGKSKIVAGGVNSTLIDMPTSAAFGRTVRDRHVLYVVSAGGSTVDGKVVGAQVLAIDMSKRWIF